MRATLPGDFIIAEALDDYAFGADVQREADESIEWASLFIWYDTYYWDIEWVCGPWATHNLSLEQLWACMHNAKTVTAIGASKWSQSRAERVRERLGWYCSPVETPKRGVVVPLVMKRLSD